MIKLIDILGEGKEIGGYYLMKQLKDIAQDAKRNGEGKLNKALMYLYARINQSYRDSDVSSNDILDLLTDPRGRKYSKDIPTWMIDDLFEGIVRYNVYSNNKGSDANVYANKDLGKSPREGFYAEIDNNYDKGFKNKAEIETWLRKNNYKHIGVDKEHY